MVHEYKGHRQHPSTQTRLPGWRRARSRARCHSPSGKLYSPRLGRSAQWPARAASGSSLSARTDCGKFAHAFLLLGVGGAGSHPGSPCRRSCRRSPTLAAEPMRSSVAGSLQHTTTLPWGCIAANAKSQWGEDRLLMPLLLDATRGGPGVFVELGALDGDTYSNTILLERCFNWTGVLIEANPANFARLQQSGRRATLVHSAVCVGIPSITMTLHGGPASGDVSTFTGWQKRRFNMNQTVTVPCKSLTQIMQDAGHPTAHFLSLDVEGAGHSTIVVKCTPSICALLWAYAACASRSRTATPSEATASFALTLHSRYTHVTLATARLTTCSVCLAQRTRCSRPSMWPSSLS